MRVNHKLMGSRGDIPFERAIKTTYPIPRHVPTCIMEDTMAQRNRVFTKSGLTLRNDANGAQCSRHEKRLLASG